jgi:hypothetical protein
VNVSIVPDDEGRRWNHMVYEAPKKGKEPAKENKPKDMKDAKKGGKK